MGLFNVWHPMQHGKTTVKAREDQEARDYFCQRWGYADEAHYCLCNKLEHSNLKTEAVGSLQDRVSASEYRGRPS